MSKKNYPRPHDIFNELEELPFDKILKKLPDNITEATIDKSDPTEIMHILMSAKIIVAFGAFNTGLKLVELIGKHLQKAPKTDLLGPLNKVLISFFGIMYDLQRYNELHSFVMSLGDKVISQLLEADGHFKSLWALILLEKSPPDVALAKDLYEKLLQDKAQAFSQNSNMAISFSHTLFERKLKSPEEVIAFCEALEKKLNNNFPANLYNLKAQAFKELGNLSLAHKNASAFAQELSPNLITANYHSRVLLNDIRPAESIDTKVLLKMYPQLQHRIIAKDLTEDADEDLYVIRGNDLRITKYELIEHERKESVLDLVSGLYRYKNRKVFLSRNRILAMKAIIAMGDIGIKDVLIGEYLFLDENVAFNSVRKRSQDLVTQLQKIDIPLIRKDNTIFYDFANSPLTVLVGAKEVRGEIAYLKKKHRVINKKIVTYELMTKPSTSSLYLKKWRDENKITPTNNPYGDYRFV